MKKSRRDFLGKITKVAGSAIAITAVAGTSLHAKRGKNESSTETLSEKQKDMLFFIYQEEKVARDVYITLGKKYSDENTFAMIQLSEQKHIEAAGSLCETYGVDISYVNLDLVGHFELTHMQELYDTCVKQGMISHIEALRVGELIEITDIDDLVTASKGMPADVVAVYDNLKDGSISHLDAFRRAIKRA